MPEILTAQTAHELVVSFNTSNNEPITGATFTTNAFKDGVIDTGITVNITLTDPVEGVFDASWSANTVGTYQLYIQNDVTDVIYVSDIYNVGSTGSDTIVYVGL